jgi:hypothetical protein
MEMNLMVIEKEEGMVAVRKANGDTLKKDVYDLVTGLLGMFKKTVCGTRNSSMLILDTNECMRWSKLI